MPAESPFQSVEKPWRHPAEMRFFYVAVLYIIRDSVCKNVIDLAVSNAKPMALEQFAAFAARIGVGNWTTHLCFRVLGHQFLRSAESTPPSTTAGDTP